jgi:DNA-binding MarR family transcriptional regulator
MENPFGRYLSQIAKNYLHLINHHLAHLDIERNYFALVLIEKEDGKITQQELADMLEVDKVTMLRSIDYLSVKGYVKRIRHKTDRRKYVLQLTKKARTAMPEIKKTLNKINDIAFEGLSVVEQKQLFHALSVIKSNITNIKNSI